MFRQVPRSARPPRTCELVAGVPVPKVLIIGPGPTVRGGITTVIDAYRHSFLWSKYSCSWLSSYEDTSVLAKITSAVRALACAPVLMWNKDIIHIHGSLRTSTLRKSLFVLIAHCLRKRIIYHVHTSILDHLSGHFFKRILSLSDVVVALSPGLATRLRPFCGQTPVVSIPNPVLLPEVTLYQSHSGRILFVGRLEPGKGYLDLLRALARVFAEMPGASAVFAGHGDIRAAAQIAAELEISDKVHFTGWLSHDSMRAEYRRASVFCLPSYSEGLPMAVLEAMSHSLPVVVTPVGGVPDLIHPGVNGLLVKAGDVVAMASAIVGLLQDSELRTSLGKAARLTVERFYRSDRVCGRLSELYASLRR